MSYVYRNNCFLSDGPFLRHVVMMNYAGKVYSVLRNRWRHNPTLNEQASLCLRGVHDPRHVLVPLHLEEDPGPHSKRICPTDMASSMYITLGAAIYCLFAVFPCGLQRTHNPRLYHWGYGMSGANHCQQLGV